MGVSACIVSGVRGYCNYSPISARVVRLGEGTREDDSKWAAESVRHCTCIRVRMVEQRKAYQAKLGE